LIKEIFDKKLFLIVTLVFVAITWAQAQTVLDFKLVNKTGEDFYAVYLTASDVEDWGEDICPDDIIADGDVVEITFEYDKSKNLKRIYDLRLTHDEDEKEWIYIKKLDLSAVKILTIYIDDDGDYAFKIE
jgi:hypothetical protein